MSKCFSILDGGSSPIFQISIPPPRVCKATRADIVHPPPTSISTRNTNNPSTVAMCNKLHLFNFLLSVWLSIIKPACRVARSQCDLTLFSRAVTETLTPYLVPSSKHLLRQHFLAEPCFLSGSEGLDLEFELSMQDL
jgi:hypothetical protein